VSKQLLPLSNELITAALQARDFTYSLDDDGDVVGNWQGTLIYFFRIGARREVLQLRALTPRVFSTDDVPLLYAFCNAWNHDKLFPKAYVHVADDGAARVVGELVTDWEHGVTPEQLDQMMICGIATSCELADAVNELASLR
jgi:hypothetical protein